MSKHKKLYNSKAWKVRREQQLTKEPFCRYCQQAGRQTVATVADHIEPHRGDAESFYKGALQSLCDTCHSAVKQAEEAGSGLRGGTVEGHPLDPGHHWNQ